MTAPGPSPRVLVVGDVMTDIICVPEGPLVPGSDRRAVIRTHPGGSGANQAIWLAAFGLQVRFAGRVGRADVGALSNHFADHGVEPELAGDSDLPTGQLVTILDPQGERSFLTDRGANTALSSGDLPERLLDDVALLLVSGYALFSPIPREAVLRLFEQARARHIPIAVDPASIGFLEEVGPEAFLTWTAPASTIFANAAEAARLTGLPDLTSQLSALLQHYRRVIIKRGAQGAVLALAGAPPIDCPPVAVEVVDTTGAGDAFAAAFIAADLAGSSPRACLEQAVAAGAGAVRQLGGQPR